MAQFVIYGGRPLRGAAAISASKNAVLPILAACLLTAETVRLHEIPWLDDVDVLNRMLRSLGAYSERERCALEVAAEDIDPCAAPEHLIRRMRASFLIAGPLLSRFGQARVALPGGCAIGSRPIDLHLKGFRLLGADVRNTSGYIELRTTGRLHGANIYLDFPSVGATENLMMAAALADGVTTIENAAQEPEIVDLANFVNAMGGEVRGAGTAVIRVAGASALHGCEYTIIPDRIEAGTYLLAAAATQGDVTVAPAVAAHLQPVLAKLREAGGEITVQGDSIRLRQSGPMRGVDVKTFPHPGFPTDMQAPWMGALSTAVGTSVITETVFENRFMHVAELRRMGAQIKIEGSTAVLNGVPSLCGATVRASDLRAAAGLIIAALTANGQTVVLEAEHVDRGYHQIERKLADLGAAMERTVCLA